MPIVRNQLAVTSTSAARRGLPAIGFSADLDGAGLWGGVFPDDKAYARLSGPPGGPLFVAIVPLPGTRADTAALEALARREFAGEANAPITFGESGEIDVAGENRPAVLCFIGQRHPLMAAGAIVVGIEVPDALGGPAALAIIAGCGGTPDFLTDPLAVAGHPSICRVLETFQLGDVEGADEPADTGAAAPATSHAASEPAAEAEPEPQPDAAPEPEPGLSAAAAVALLGDVQQVMRRSGLWRDAPPGMSDYTSMSMAQQMAWSLQSTLPSASDMLARVKEMNAGPEAERGAVEGVLQMLAAWPEMFRPYPEAAELVSVLERGPAA